jgi:hypothetical protein
MKKLIFGILSLFIFLTLTNANASSSSKPIPWVKSSFNNKELYKFAFRGFRIPIHVEHHIPGTDCSVIVDGYLDIRGFNPFEPEEMLVTSYVTVSLGCGPGCRSVQVKDLPLLETGVFKSISFEETGDADIDHFLSDEDVLSEILDQVNAGIPAEE